jgi:hypothetical protein
MQYESLSHTDPVEKAIILTNNIIVKALESERGDIIRVMSVAGHKKMIKSVFKAVYNKLYQEVELAYEHELDKYLLKLDGIASDLIGKFKPSTDVEIEEDVSAFFEVNGKLQYRKVKLDRFIVLPGIDKSVNWLTKQMNEIARVMQIDLSSVADRLEKADILTNLEIMVALLDVESWDGDAIREMSHAEFKQFRKDVFSGFYHELCTELVDFFEELRAYYVPERDGIENDPRKNFKPKTEFEIDQEIKAYFEEQGTLH